jgi:hypothetical protein
MLLATDPVQRVHLLSLNKAPHYYNHTFHFIDKELVMHTFSIINKASVQSAKFCLIVMSQDSYINN